MSVMSPHVSHVPFVAEGGITRTMRAAAGRAVALKVLRVAIVRAGRIVDERIVRDGTAVTFGAGEGAMLAGLRAPFALFEARGGEWFLNVASGMSGRIADSDEGVTEIAAVRAALPRRGDVQPLRLSEESRGRVVLDGETILFQFVDPPRDTRPMLPASLKRTLGIDWNLALVSAFTFAAHFGALAYAFTTWDAEVPQRNVATVEVLDPSTSTPTALPVIASTHTDSQPSDANGAANAGATSSSTTSSALPSHGAPIATHGPAAAPTDPLWFLQHSFIPADPALSHADPAATAAHAPLPGTDDPRLPGVVPVAPGAFDPTGRPDPGPIAWHSTDPGSADPGQTPTYVPPVPSDPGTPPPVPRAALPDGESVIRSQLAAAVHACYQRGLAANPLEQGTVGVFLRVAADGTVSSVSVSSAGIDVPTTSCIRSAAGRVHFRPSAAGGSVSASFTLVRQ
jgi:hypothetical protein